MPDEARDGRNVALIDKCFIAPICTTSICGLTITISSINTHTQHMNAKSVLHLTTFGG